MTRSFKHIAFRLTRAIVQSILLAGTLVVAYHVLRIVVAVGGVIADAWHAEFWIFLLMLVAGVGMCGLAGHMLGDDRPGDGQPPGKPSKN